MSLVVREPIRRVAKSECERHDMQVPAGYRDPSIRIGVFSLCDYSPESPMHWLPGPHGMATDSARG